MKIWKRVLRLSAIIALALGVIVAVALITKKTQALRSGVAHQVNAQDIERHYSELIANMAGLGECGGVFPNAKLNLCYDLASPPAILGASVGGDSSGLTLSHKNFEFVRDQPLNSLAWGVPKVGKALITTYPVKLKDGRRINLLDYSAKFLTKRGTEWNITLLFDEQLLSRVLQNNSENQEANHP
jgi:hypothetical protein